MNEAQMSILRMLSEGKISPEDAERLLEAVDADGVGREGREGRGGRRQRPERSPWDAETEDDFFKRAFNATPRQMAVGPETTVRVTNRMGSIHLVGTDGDTLRVEAAAPRSYEMAQNGQEIQVRSRGFGSALTVYVPVTVARLRADTDLGELQAKGLGGIAEVQLLTHVGSVALELDENTGEGQRISVRSDVGSIAANVSPRAHCEIRAITDQFGDVQNRATLEAIAEGGGQYHGRLNGGGADVRLATRIGAVMISDGE